MRLLLCALLIGPLAVFEAAAGGRIEVRVTDHRAGIENFRSLTISVSEVWLHRSGRARRDGWTAALKDSRPVDIVPLKDGKWEKVGIGALPAGKYDAIRVDAIVREARHKGTNAVAMDPMSTVIAFHDEVEIKKDVLLPVLLDFHVEDQTDHAPPRYVLKLRHVAIGQDPPVTGGGR
ncbi:MAG: DUF4382 domain-containing protein [Burkholderiales bacterium]